MPIQDVFSVKGTTGFLLVGPVERGTLFRGQDIEIVGLDMPPLLVKASELAKEGIGGARSGLKQINAGEYGGVFLPNAYRSNVKRGMVAVAPGSITPHAAIIGEFYLLRPEEGGRDKPILLVFNHAESYPPYIAQFYIYGMDFGSVMQHPFPENLDYFELGPGDTAELRFCFIVPVPLEPGMIFRLRRGSQVVGKGVITRVLNDCSSST